MPHITWSGYARMGPPMKVFDKVKTCLFKMAVSKYVRCHVKQNYSGDIKDWMIHCVLVENIKKVVMRYRDVVVFVALENIKPKYKLKFTRTHHLVVPAM